MSERVQFLAKMPEVKRENKTPQTRNTEFSQSIKSPGDHVLFLQRTIGNQAVQRLIKSGALQAKLRIGKPGDIYEQEADRVAERVMKMPEVSEKLTKDAGTSIPILGEEQIVDICPKSCSNHDTTNPLIPEDTEARFNAISGGRPLPESVRAFFEPRFGFDFSRVRVHTDAKAAESARAVNALAYTMGRDVVFDEGQYAPERSEGKKLLAHELTHVVQQGHGQAKNGEIAIQKSPPMVQGLWPEIIGGAIGGIIGGVGGFFLGGPLGAAAGAVLGAAAGAGIGHLVAGNCNQPVSMNKVTAGAFQGGFSMDDYYPDLVGRGYYQHGNTAGPFDTGTRAGSNAQLYGIIPGSCASGSFSLAQTVQYTRAIRDGVHHPQEGVVQDDIAKSGRDASRAPFRREWAGGGLLMISMADPPSIVYGPASNIEWDRAFVTSLVGPGGRRSVNWSTSIRVVNGSVTRNTVT